jgi:hypothetical protein
VLFLLVGIQRVGRWYIIHGQNVHTNFHENTMTDIKVGRHTHIFTARRSFLGKKVKNGKTFLCWKWSVFFETLHTSVRNTVLNVAEICSYIFGNSRTLICIPCPAPPSHHHLYYLAVKELGHLFTRYNFSTMRILGSHENITETTRQDTIKHLAWKELGTNATIKIMPKPLLKISSEKFCLTVTDLSNQSSTPITYSRDF